MEKDGRENRALRAATIGISIIGVVGLALGYFIGKNEPKKIDYYERYGQGIIEFQYRDHLFNCCEMNNTLLKRKLTGETVNDILYDCNSIKLFDSCSSLEQRFPYTINFSPRYIQHDFEVYSHLKP